MLKQTNAGNSERCFGLKNMWSFTVTNLLTKQNYSDATLPMTKNYTLLINAQIKAIASFK